MGILLERQVTILGFDLRPDLLWPLRDTRTSTGTIGGRSGKRQNVYVPSLQNIVYLVVVFEEKTPRFQTFRVSADANRDILGKKLTSDNSLFTFYESQQAAASKQDFRVIFKGCIGL